MTAIVLDRARDIIALTEGKNEEEVANLHNKGELRGRKTVPLTFYLHAAGTVIGGVAAVALTISALVLSIFALHIAAAACILLCLTNAIAALMIKRLAPEKDLNSVITKLCNKIEGFLKKDQEAKLKAVEEKPIIKDKVIENKEVKKKIIEKPKLQEKVIEKKEVVEIKKAEPNPNDELILKLKNCLHEYAIKHEDEKNTLNENLNEILEIYQREGRDPTKINDVKVAIENLNSYKEVDDIDKSIEKLLQNNQNFNCQFVTLCELLKKLIAEDFKELKQENAELKSKIEELENTEKELEENIKQKEKEIEELKTHQEDFKSLLNSDINI